MEHIRSFCHCTQAVCLKLEVLGFSFPEKQVVGFDGGVATSAWENVTDRTA